VGGNFDREECDAAKRIAVCGHALDGGAGMKLFRILRAALREIFDEAAYERFCKRERLAEGQASYSRFVKQTTAKQKVRCC
jgi:hypothetical protein